jgi:NarL family two-component system response regulator YdfI
VIRVLIVAESAVWRAGLEALVLSTPGMQVVDACSDLTEVNGARADVVVAAAPAAEISKLRDNETPVVLVSDTPRPVWSAAAVQHGVRALLPRDASESQILAAVEAVANGLAVLDPRELHTLVSAPAAIQAAAEPSGLTDRELQVLRMMADGAANKIIAWKLGISEHTVRFHVASILAKLGASSRTEAVTIGIRKGLVLL